MYVGNILLARCGSGNHPNAIVELPKGILYCLKTLLNKLSPGAILKILNKQPGVYPVQSEQTAASSKHWQICAGHPGELQPWLVHLRSLLVLNLFYQWV